MVRERSYALLDTSAISPARSFFGSSIQVRRVCHLYGDPSHLRQGHRPAGSAAETGQGRDNSTAMCVIERAHTAPD